MDTSDQLALTGTGTVLHLLDRQSAPGDARTLCGRPNACTAMGYGTPDEPRTPLCAHCASLRGGAAFRCPRCDRVSHHPKDRDEGYCGHCHAFTGPRAPTIDELIEASSLGSPSARHIIEREEKRKSQRLTGMPEEQADWDQ